MAATVSEAVFLECPRAPVEENTVGLGSRVLIADHDGEEEYVIVPEYEAEPALRRISSRSPLATALLGHSRGEEVSVVAPGGRRVVCILRVC